MALAGWVADNPSASELYELLLSSSQVSTGGQYLSNLARWRQPEMDAALATCRADPAPANRRVIGSASASPGIRYTLHHTS